jgi:hypothetical protein
MPTMWPAPLQRPRDMLLLRQQLLHPVVVEILNHLHLHSKRVLARGENCMVALPLSNPALTFVQAYPVTWRY